jgi:glycosyltransferase involved in cell wall biosynthesis
MRIGMMADVYKPHVSGITSYISLNKKHLEDMGHQVYVFAFGDEDYQDDEPGVIRSPGLPLLDTGYYISLRYGRSARRLLRTMDVVHVHHPFLSGSLALRYCKPRGIPIVFTNHTRYDLYAQAYLPVLSEVIGETSMRGYLPPFCRACDLVISPSRGMREILEGFGVDAPITVVPNGVELGPFRKPPHPVDRAAQGFSQEDVLLIYSGRLGPEKNLRFLLRSFAGAALTYSHIGLVLVGDGPAREELQDWVEQLDLSSRVRFTGMVPYEEMPGYLAMADAFVTASVTEVHPFTVIEAMAAGRPVLGIQSPGVGDTVEDGVTGLLVPNEDMAAFTAKMVWLVTEHDRRREMGCQASEAAQAYAIERTTRIMVDCYQGVIEAAKQRKQPLRGRFLRYIDNL